MSSIVRLVFKIQEEGEAILKAIPKQLEAVNQAIQKTNVAPLDQVAKSIKSIDTNTKEASNSLSNIENAFKRVFKSIVQQSVKSLDESTNQFTKISQRGLEKTLAVGAGVAGALALASTQMVQRFVSGLVRVEGFTNKIGFAAEAIGLGLTSAVGGAFEIITSKILTAQTIFNGWVTGVISDIGIVGFALTGFLGSLSGFVIFRTLLSETQLFFRRLSGQGLEALTPIERLVRLVTTLDIALNQVGFTAGQVLKTSLLGLTQITSILVPGIINPLFVAIPFLNSLVTTIFNTFQRNILGGLAFFGSAQARLRLIFLDLKEIAQLVLPILLDRAKQFTTFFGGDLLAKQARAANQEIKDLTKSTEALNTQGNRISFLQGITRRSQPIAVQFQSFVVEFKQFLTEIIAQAEKIFRIIAAGFGISKQGIASIEADSSKTANEVLSKVNQTGAAFDAILQKKSLSKAIAEATTGAGRLLKSLFTLDFSGFAKGLFNAFGSTFRGVSAQVKNASKSLFASSTPQQTSQIISEKETNNIQKVSSALGGLNPVLLQIRQEVSKLRAAFVLFAATIPTAFSPTIADEFTSDLGATSKATITLTKQVQAVAQAVKTSASGIKTEVESVLTKVFDLSTITQKLSTDIKQVQKSGTPQFSEALFKTQGSPAALANFVQEIEKLSRGAGKLESVQKNLRGFFALLETLSSPKFGRTLDIGAIFKFADDPKFLQAPKNLDDFRKKFDEFAKALGTTATKASSEFGKQLNQGLRSGASTEQIQQALNKLLQVFLEFLPQSPAKAGPLVKLPKMGKEIVNQLSQGMKQGETQAGKAASDVAERIAKYFPRSPALLGPLILLPKMGLGIALQLAQGMLGGIPSINDAANQIAQAVFGTITRATDLQRLSERIGISTELLSSFNLALASSGANTSDLTFAFQSLQRILSRTLTPEEFKKIQGLGIDLEKARTANEPLIALFFQLSDRLKAVGADSEEFTQILETLGVTANSNIVNVLLKGSTELRNLQVEAVKAGTTTSASFGKLAQEFSGLQSKFEQVKNTLLEGFIEEILPTLNQAGKEIFQLFVDNQQTIEAFFRTVGRIFAFATQQVIQFTKIIIVEPERALGIVLELINSFAKFAFQTFDIGFDIISRAFGNFFKGLAPIVLSGLFELGIDIIAGAKDLILDTLQFILDSIGEGLTALGNSVLNKITSIFSDIFIGINKAVKAIPGGESLINAAGFTLLSDKDIASLEKQNAELEHKTLGFTDTITKLYTEFADKNKGKFKGKVETLVKELIPQDEDVANFKDSLQELTGAWSKTVEEINKKEFSREEINQRFEDLGETFQAGFKKVFSFAFADDTQNQILEGLGFIKDGFVGTLKSIVDSDPARRFKNFFAETFSGAKSQVALDQAKELANLGKSIEGSVLSTKPQSLKEAEPARSKLAEDEASILPKFSPEDELTFAIEDLKNATEQELPFIKEQFQSTFQSIVEANPFAALDASFELWVNSVGEKATIAGEAFVTALKGTLGAFGSVTEPLAQAFDNLFELTGKKSKALFFISKAIAIADATVKGAQAVLNAYATVPYPANIAAAISTGALVATQIAAIVGATVKGFATGGIVEGPSGRDVIPARLTAGEYVQPTSAVGFYGLPAMEAIKNRLLPRDFASNLISNLPTRFTSPASLRFETGGVVPSASESLQQANTQRTDQKEGGKEILIQNINVVDPSQFDKYLKSSRGTRMIMNVINDNQSEVKRSLGIRG